MKVLSYSIFELLPRPLQRANFRSPLSGNEFEGILLQCAPFKEGLETFQGHH